MFIVIEGSLAGIPPARCSQHIGRKISRCLPRIRLSHPALVCMSGIQKQAGFCGMKTKAYDSSRRNNWVLVKYPKLNKLWLSTRCDFFKKNGPSLTSGINKLLNAMAIPFFHFSHRIAALFLACALNNISSGLFKNSCFFLFNLRIGISL